MSSCNIDNPRQRMRQNPRNHLLRRDFLRAGVFGLLAGSGLALPGCFRPMLAEDGEAVDLHGRIALPEIEGRRGYHLVKALQSRLGVPVNPEWELRVLVGASKSDLAISRSDDITRIAVRATADWSLHRKGEKKPILKSRAISESGYESTASIYGTREARLDIERRLAKDLGERIARAVLARADEILASGSDT